MTKKILLALSLALMAIVMASAVSADEKVTIDGIDFNIPEGYTEDVDSEVVNETETDDGVTYVSNGKFFDNGNYTMLLLVADYGDANATEAAFAEVEGENLTIQNTTGKLVDLGFLKIYAYLEDGKLVTLTTDGPDEIEKFVI